MNANNFTFTRAVQTRGKARVALTGPAGAGKTYSALRIARGLAGENGRIAGIDTEHGSMSKYAKKFVFDVLELDSFAPQKFVAAIDAAGEAGYDVVIVDSLSHEWSGKDGALQMVDKVATQQNMGGNKFAAWNTVTPLHDAVFEAILRSPCHVIGTMRGKTEYVLETNDRGKQVPRKVGMGAVQRDGVEYEFDVVGDLDMDHTLVVTKTRCEALDGAVIKLPGENLAETLLEWLSEGVEARPRPASVPTDAPQRTEPAAKPEEGIARREDIERITSQIAQVARLLSIDGADLAGEMRAELQLPKEKQLTTENVGRMLEWLAKKNVQQIEGALADEPTPA